MKLNHILKEIQNTPAGSFEQKTDRRDILKNFGTKLAAAAVPMFASMGKVQAKTTDALAEAIYFLLTATHIQIAFYEEAFAKNAPIPPEAMLDFNKILNDKKAHRAYWYSVLTNTGNPLPTVPTYDFSAGNAYPKAFTHYNEFLALAHTLEDVGIRIYAQAIQELASNKSLRGDAVNVRCTIARHAAHVRLLRRNLGVDMMPWINGSDANTIVGELIQGYQGEEVTVQGKYQVIDINGAAVSMKAASEAFDEPMGLLVAEAFIKNFTV